MGFHAIPLLKFAYLKERTMQLNLFSTHPPVVHYFDREGALHSGYMVRRIRRGKHRGQCIVVNAQGRSQVAWQVRNIEYP